MDERSEGRNEEGPNSEPPSVASPTSMDFPSRVTHSAGLNPKHNRPKSKRSGGPQSPLGQETCSRNAIKHGAYEKRLPDLYDFYQHASQVRVEINPHGVIEETLAMSLAHETYKISRLNEMERTRVLRLTAEIINPKAMAEKVHFPWGERHAALLVEPVNTVLLQKEIFQNWKKLAAPPKKGFADPALSLPDQRVAEIYQLGCELLGTPGLSVHMEETFFKRLDVVMHEALTPISYLGQRIEKQNAEIALVQYWIFRNASLIHACQEMLLQDQVLEVWSDEKFSRANKHISSKISQNLSSLTLLRAIKNGTIEEIKSAHSHSFRQKCDDQGPWRN